MRPWWGLLLASCVASPPRDTGGVRDDGYPDSCVTVSEGIWTIDGPALGNMPMTARLTFAPDWCAFDLTEWSMDHGQPDGGLVDGESVRLTGSAYYEDCAGGVLDDGARIEGTCPGSQHPMGDTFVMAWTGDP